MTGNMKVGVALVGGYLLGRTKKAKMAIGFGMFLAGKKLNFDPKQLGKLVANSPVLGTLNNQVREQLVDATRSAATNALTQRASGLADSLHRRTLDLEDPDGREDARADERDEDEGDADEKARQQDRKPASRRKSASKSPAESSAGSTAGTTSGARRTDSGDARKKTTSTARKTASRGRKTASSAARKEGGGRNG